MSISHAKFLVNPGLPSIEETRKKSLRKSFSVLREVALMKVDVPVNN